MRTDRKAQKETIAPLAQIERAILLIRGRKVMLDRDLAVLYGTETRILSQAVKRNHERFPEDFMFQLSRQEILRISQSVTSLRDVKYSKVVHAFTEQGVAMLSSVLKSQEAIAVNIAIMRAFVRLREFLLTHSRLTKRLHQLENQVTSHDQAIGTLFEAIQELTSERPSAIGFQTDT